MRFLRKAAWRMWICCIQCTMGQTVLLLLGLLKKCRCVVKDVVPQCGMSEAACPDTKKHPFRITERVLTFFDEFNNITLQKLRGVGNLPKKDQPR